MSISYGPLPLLPGSGLATGNDPIWQIVLDLIISGVHGGLIVSPEHLRLETCLLQSHAHIHRKLINLQERRKEELLATITGVR